MNLIDKFKQKSLNERFLFVLGFLFSVIYLTLGIIIAFTNVFPLTMAANFKLMFGITLIVYGVFRFVRLLI